MGFEGNFSSGGGDGDGDGGDSSLLPLGQKYSPDVEGLEGSTIFVCYVPEEREAGACFIVAGGALNPGLSDTDYATLEFLSKKHGVGLVGTVALATTKVTGGTGAWGVNVEIAIPAYVGEGAVTTLPADSWIECIVSKTGASGVGLPNFGAGMKPVTE